MEIWLDTIDIDTIKLAKNLGVLHGITTNPSILAKTQNPMEAIQSLVKLHSGPIAVQVLGKDSEEMIEEGKKWHSISPKIIVKVPVTQQGLGAIHALAQQGIPTMGTVIYHSNQALLAVSAGAKYIAPYLAHLIRYDAEGLLHFQLMRKMLHTYSFDAKVLVASIHTLEQITLCIESGMDAITLKEDLFKEFVQDHEMTLEKVELFAKDWATTQA